LGLEIAQHLLRSEIDAGKYGIEQIVRETLHESRVGRAECLVHLHPDDYERLSDVPFRSGTKLQPDDGVPRGEVQVESALGCIVRDIDRALESIGERLRGELNR
jgi:flagellar biosynthesis/type III secretory pathway protein FliH